MKNQVIEVLNKEHGKKVIEYWKNRGFDIRGFIGSCTKENKNIYRYYGVIDGSFNNYPLEDAIEYNAEIITLPDEKTFPRKMLVWDDNEGSAVETYVLHVNPFGNPLYPILGVSVNHKKQFEDGLEYYTHIWKHAKEIPEVKELTIEEAVKKLSEVFGMEVKIKDERIA